MNLKEIVNRHNSIPIEEEEAYLVIKEYVKVRKNVDIKPKIDYFRAISQIKFMHRMLNIAIGWFRQNHSEMKHSSNDK